MNHKGRRPNVQISENEVNNAKELAMNSVQNSREEAPKSSDIPIRAPNQEAAKGEHIVVRGMNKGSVITKVVVVGDVVFFDVNEEPLESKGEGGEHFSDPPIDSIIEEINPPDALPLGDPIEFEGGLPSGQLPKQC